MALPTTISGASISSSATQNYLGPFISSGGNFYFIARAALASLGAFKATDPTDSFSEVDSGNRPPISNNSSHSLNVYQVGDKLHIASQSIVSVSTIRYARLDMSLDAWDILDGGSARVIEVANPDTGSDALGTTSACDITVLSGGDIRIVAQGAQVKDMGTAYAQVAHWESTDSGATWSSATTVNGSTFDDYSGPRIVLPPANSDQCHIMYRRATSGELYQRAISSAGTLRTERATGINNLDVYGVGNVLGFDRT